MDISSILPVQSAGGSGQFQQKATNEASKETTSLAAPADVVEISDTARMRLYALQEPEKNEAIEEDTPPPSPPPADAQNVYQESEPVSAGSNAQGSSAVSSGVSVTA